MSIAASPQLIIEFECAIVQGCKWMSSNITWGTPYVRTRPLGYMAERTSNHHTQRRFSVNVRILLPLCCRGGLRSLVPRSRHWVNTGFPDILTFFPILIEASVSSLLLVNLRNCLGLPAMSHLDLKMEGPQGHTLTDKAFQLLRNYLQPDTTLTLESTVRSVLSLLPENVPLSTEIWSFGEICIELAEQIPFHHRSQLKLSALLESLGKSTKLGQAVTSKVYMLTNRDFRYQLLLMIPRVQSRANIWSPSGIRWVPRTQRIQANTVIFFILGRKETHEIIVLFEYAH